MLKHHLKLVLRRRAFWTAAAPSSPFTKYSENYPSKIDYKVLFSSLPPTQLTRLPNRLRVATQLLPTNNTTTVGIWVDPGSYVASLKWKGIHHLLERLIFKGTGVEEKIEMMGGKLVAQTSFKQISIQATGLLSGEDLFRPLKFLFSVLENPKFTDQDIDRELALLLRERHEAEDKLTKDFILENLHANSFQNSDVGISIFGSASNIRTATKQDIFNYMSELTTDRMVLVVAGGGICHEEIVGQAKFLFNKPGREVILKKVIKHGEDIYTKLLRSPKEIFSTGSAIFKGCEVRIDDCNQVLAQFAIAFNGACRADYNCIPLMIIKEMLSSTLLARIGSNQLAQSMGAFNTNYKDSGLFGVYALAMPDCLGDLACLVMLELTKLCSKRSVISEDELVRARNKVKATLLRDMDKTSCVAEDIGRQILAHGRRITYAELFASIDAVDVEKIKKVASLFINDKDIAIVAAGCLQGLPDYNWLRRRT
ncbi:Mitochondrial processing peptidase, beta subunit, and related enzymes (Insulinase superfamily) [Heracleum sosnowskyi]|uniref:Mitochondrial processing peptidase, beta subunit, and related enzymes (Insulinase superfamily) n=1 Tax=Heracleum sosnowskyi TaxID=360622 RepID=A0AAD8MW07_9APIA|nr:Mitochondrial processing peptidase, beta subunit, and related enzymes (Insulinase superfamily) [Heracleum sosnowskyi]KAK1387109.1 Mitochondrial processing peptidase, beta subunit, and related enzymes (Insulinase superfamily) [Heracleum sosnowskyi]